MTLQTSPVTMSAPSLSMEDMAVRQRKLDDRDTRLLTVITILTAIGAAFCAVVAFQVNQYNTTAEPVPECEEGELPSSCPDGESCQGGTCVAPTAPTRCERGAMCDDSCSCESPLACSERNVCTLPNDPGVCDDRSVLKFLTLLKEKCGDAKKCETKDIDKYVLAFEDFLTLMMQFPSTMAVHFPDNKPSPAALKRWPSNEESKHYINRIRENLDELKAADRIIMVGLASRGRKQKDPNANKEITLQRLLTTQNWIYRAATSALELKEAEAIEAKTMFIQLGDQRSIDARFYGSQYGNRPIGWDSGVETQLRSLVENGDQTGEPAELRWRDRTLNQVVFIIPIPCKLPGV